MKLLFSVFDLFPKLLNMFAEITEFNWLELWKPVTQPVATQVASRNLPVSTRNHKQHQPKPRLRVPLRLVTRPWWTEISIATRNQLLRLVISGCDSRSPLRLETTLYTHTVGPSLSRAQSIEPNDLNCGLFINGLVCVCYLGRLRIWIVLLLGCLCHWAGYEWT